MAIGLRKYRYVGTRIPVILVLTWAAVTFPLRANVLQPGDTNKLPDVFSLASPPPLLGDITGTYNLGSGALTGTWESVVLVDPLGITCAGCLDFGFSVTLDAGLPATDGIFFLTLSRFFGYTTDVGYISNSGAVAPVSVSRGPGGNGITFSLPTSNQIVGNQILAPGKDTVFLLVATNATTYDSLGSLAVAGSNGTAVFGQIDGLFEPSVPEPSTALFLASGLMAMWAGWRKLH